MQDSALSLLPPILAIVIAVWRKNALLALFAGTVFCYLLANMSAPLDIITSTSNGFIDVFSSIGNVYIISFSLLIGALVRLMNQSGAVNGFIQMLSTLNIVKNQRHAAILPTVVGTSIFTDTNLSMFSAGMASQRLFDRYQLSRARLAYLIDSTCAPISILFLINGWGAYVLGLLDGYSFDDPVGILIGTIGYNFYAIIAVAMAYYTAYSGKVFGPMQHSAHTPEVTETHEAEKQGPAFIMWLPLISLLVITLVLLYVTGNGDMRKGSGSFSVFWAIVSALIILVTLIKAKGLMSFKEIILESGKGIKHMAPAVMILVLSFTFGDAIKALGTGTYLSQLIDLQVPLFLVAPIIFLVAAFMAFATGTSWGTFAVLIPIAVPVAQQTGLPIEFLVAAVLGGGIFGDHASPISDTTVVASIASGCDHFEHVKTQLPYALFGAVVTLVIYTMIGFTF